jgi:hypothetical protein
MQCPQAGSTRYRDKRSSGTQIEDGCVARQTAVAVEADSERHESSSLRFRSSRTDAS